MLEQKLMEWVKNVVEVQNLKEHQFADTYQMIVDVDKIIAEAFDHAPIIK